MHVVNARVVWLSTVHQRSMIRTQIAQIFTDSMEQPASLPPQPFAEALF